MRRDPGGILGVLDDGFVRRMRNWASATVGHSKGYAAVDLEVPGGGGYREASMPVLGGEAADTDRALQEVPVRMRRAVELYWVWEDSELCVLAQRCGGIDYRTYVDRVKLGHELLRAELARMAERVRAFRRENETRVLAAGGVR